MVFPERGSNVSALTAPNEQPATNLRKYARLGRGLVFDDEVAAQADAHLTEARSNAADNFEEAPR